MPHFMIVLILCINLLNLSSIKKMSVFEKCGTFNTGFTVYPDVNNEDLLIRTSCAFAQCVYVLAVSECCRYIMKVNGKLPEDFICRLSWIFSSGGSRIFPFPMDSFSERTTCARKQTGSQPVVSLVKFRKCIQFPYCAQPSSNFAKFPRKQFEPVHDKNYNKTYMISRLRSVCTSTQNPSG